MQKREIQIIKFQHLQNREVQFIGLNQIHQIYLLKYLIIVQL
jgi:hypothetical protein